VKKTDVIELVQRLPDEIDIEELMYQLYVRMKIEQAEAAIEAGDVVTHEEFSREIDEWLK
jgi:predicted transcriptional regulator